MSEGAVAAQHAWPVVLDEGPVRLRPLAYRDARPWREVRSANLDWLTPWESTHPDPGTDRPTFRQMVRSYRHEARAGRMLPFVIEVDGRLAGQVTVSGIIWGSFRSGAIGYWIDRRVAGRGHVPTAVAMVVDHCFLVMGLHRLEVNIRPENRASLRVVEKLGFRPEGVHRSYLHIDGDWRDHAGFVVLREDVPEGMLPRWRRRCAAAEPAGGTDTLRPPDPTATHR